MNLSFYKLTSSTPDQALSKLLPKILSNGMRAVVVAESEDQMDALNTSLWTLGTGSFIPHGSAKDGVDPMLQPVWLSTILENPNNADVIVFAGSPRLEALDPFHFKRLVVVFDSHNAVQTENSRRLWAHHPDSDKALWCQSKTREWIQQDSFDE